MTQRSEDNPLDDVVVSLSSYAQPHLEAALLIKQQLEKQQKNERKKDVNALNGFTPPFRVDVGCGGVSENGWIRLDYDRSFCPDVLCDAHSLVFDDNTIDEARACFSLSYMTYPVKVLKEVWRVLVPNATFKIIDYPSGHDEVNSPGVKHFLTNNFWQSVNNELTGHDFVPSNASGRWLIKSITSDFNQVGERLSFKLKLSRKQVMETFRNVSSQQTVILQKVTF